MSVSGAVPDVWTAPGPVGMPAPGFTGGVAMVALTPDQWWLLAPLAAAVVALSVLEVWLTAREVRANRRRRKRKMKGV